MKLLSTILSLSAMAYQGAAFAPSTDSISTMKKEKDQPTKPCSGPCSSCATCPFASATTTTKKNRKTTALPSATTDEIMKMTERSPCLPFILRPQNCKGYVGDVGFDPCYFSDRWNMEYLREAELKHGRICMLAWTGWVAVDLGFRVYPTPDGWSGISAFDAADAFSTIDATSAQGFWASPLANLFYALAIPELYQLSRVNEMLTEGKTSRAAGDLGWDFLSFLTDRSQEDVDRMKLAELKHARLGMLAFSAVYVQNQLGAHEFPYMGQFS